MDFAFYLKKIFNLTIFFTVIYLSVSAQNNQDCFTAIKVCTNNYNQTNANSGFGTKQEVNSSSTCLGNGETNSTWYTFKIKTGGTLSFQVVPSNAQDDYDFVLYNLTHNKCSDIMNGNITSLRCNFSSTTGSTGLDASSTLAASGAGGSNQNAILNVQPEEVYALMINNFTATTAGYALNFGGTATIYDTDAPEPMSATVSECSPNKADIHFSEDINCASIATNGSDFTITGPSAVSVVSASGSGCNLSSTAGYVRIKFSPITVPGSYTIHIKKGTDGNTVSDFCDNMVASGKEISFTVSFIGPTASIASHINTDCSNTGSAVAVVTGGTSPFIYEWNTSPQQTTTTAQNLAAGSYIFKVTDANACISSATVTIKSIGQPTITTSAVGALCDSLNSGWATVHATGNSGPYTYYWNTVPPQTNDIVTGLAPGSYTVTVTNTNGCTYESNVNVPLKGLPILTINQVNVSCNGLIAGSASVQATGTAPFTYQWSTSSTDTSKQITGLPQGNYTVTVTDAVGCTAESIVSIGSGGMQLDTTHTDLTCATIPTGTATVSPVNGIAPYNFTWLTNPVQNDSVAVQLFAGNYTVIVADAGGCMDSVTVTVNAPQVLAASVSTVQAMCGLANGSASVSVAGGIAPYSYVWSTNPVQNSLHAYGLAAGIYTITISDNAGCTVSQQAYISNPTGPSGFIGNVKDATCNKPNGSASVVNVTGNAPFVYMWNTSPVQWGANAGHLGEGIYYVMLTDAGQCVSFLHVKINAIEQATVAIENSTPASCGKSDAQATANATGGALPYTYNWSTIPAQNTATAIDLHAGSYIAVVTDGNGCTTAASVVIKENKAQNDFTFSPACLTQPVNFTATTDYNEQVTWQWQFGDNSQEQNIGTGISETSHIYNTAADYPVTLIINGGCATDTLIKQVHGAYKPEASFTTRLSHYYATARVQFIYNGTPVTTYDWDFGDDHFSNSNNPTFAWDTPNDTAYVILYVTDEYGCKDTTETNLFIDEQPAVFIPNGFTPNGDGKNDYFTIPAHGLAHCKLQIVNRWGATVYVCDNTHELESNGWNGTLNGNPAPGGIYTYMLTGKLENGKPVYSTGTLTLLR